jgi:LacI family transcriptional regulator
MPGKRYHGVCIVPRSRRAVSTTIREVAALAGVSIKTVSRVINDGGHVSDATRRQVLRAVERLDYRPNALARGLVTGRSRSLGLVIADVVNPFFPPLVRAVEDAAAARGYNVILCDTDEDPDRERTVISVLLQRYVDGLILCASRSPTAALRRLGDAGIPLVLINRTLAHRRVAAVVADSAAGARCAMSHLLDLGHRRIAYLVGPRASFSHRSRLRGYRQALAECGIPYDPDLVAGGVTSLGAGREAMAVLLTLPIPPTAVFAFDDLMAIGAVEELQRRGRRVPEDVAMVGFDDIDLAGYLSPPLSTVAQPKAEMGRLAANRLLDMIETATVPVPRTLTMVPELVVRQSCGGARATASEERKEA